MIIDLCDYLKDKPHISVSDNQHNYKNSLRFVDDNLAGFLFNIEVEDKFIIELIKESSNTIYGKYLLTVWSLPEDNNFSILKKIF